MSYRELRTIVYYLERHWFAFAAAHTGFDDPLKLEFFFLLVEFLPASALPVELSDFPVFAIVLTGSCNFDVNYTLLKTAESTATSAWLSWS